MRPPEVKLSAQIPKLAKGGFVENHICIHLDNAYIMPVGIMDKIFPPVKMPISTKDQTWIAGMQTLYYERQIAARHIQR